MEGRVTFGQDFLGHHLSRKEGHGRCLTDSLAVGHITGIFNEVVSQMSKYEGLQLPLLTKSANVNHLQPVKNGRKGEGQENGQNWLWPVLAYFRSGEVMN